MNEAAFLQTILEQPQDDLVRLAYADWLLEQGDPARAARGQFIALQIQLARRAADWVTALEMKDLARVPALKAREQELLGKYAGEWAKPVMPLVTGYTFRRGFVEIVETTCAQFEKHAATLFTLAPLRRVKLITPLTQAAARSP